MRVFGIDLGTSDTYIYEILADKSTVPVSFTGEDHKGCISTIILYDANNQPLGIGQMAEAEYYKRKNPDWTLHAQFKPEINTDPDAYKWMVDFLCLLKQQIGQEIIDNLERLCVGIPSKIRSDYAMYLEKCFQDAHWPRSPVLTFVKESEAALTTCLMNDLSILAEKNENILIFDFGGGTCDYSILNNGELVESGSDRLFGGRLFDDLFYQIIYNNCEKFRQDEDLKAENLSIANHSYHSHWIMAKKVKEDFSNAIIANIPKPDLRITWLSEHKRKEEYFSYSKEQFKWAVRAYKPSKAMLEFLATYQTKGGLSQYAMDFINGKEISLVDWLDSIFDNIKKFHKINRIVLTGGSSLWFFVKELAETSFSNAKCFISQSPFADVASGLALYDTLQKDFPKIQQKLANELADFTKLCQKQISLEFTLYANNFATTCAEYFAKNIDTVLKNEEKNIDTQTISSISEKIYQVLESDNSFTLTLAEQSHEFAIKLKTKLADEVKQWLRESDIFMPPNLNYDGIYDSAEVVRIYQVQLLEIAKDIKQFFYHIIPVIVGAAIAGGVIVVDPTFGLFSMGLGAVSGVASFLATKFFAQDFHIKIKGKEYSMLSILYLDVIRSQLLKRSKKHIQEEMQKMMHKKFSQKILDGIQARLEATLKEMLNALNTLNLVKPVKIS